MNGQSLVKAFVPLPGQAAAVYTSSGLDHYRHSDWLGSARLTSSSSQAYVSSVAYAPFGETYAPKGTTDPSFTGQSPDTVSTDNDFLFREYSNEGRWVSPDPAGLAAVDPTNPQSWNRYSYVLNRPLHLIDPLGLWCVWQDGTHDQDPVDWGDVDAQACLDQGGVWDPTDTLVGCDTNWNCTKSDGSTTPGCSADQESCIWQPSDPVTAILPNDPFGGANGGNTNGGFFSGIKDKFLNFLAAHANYLPGVCTAGAFEYGTGGAGNDKGGGQGGVLIDKQIGKPTTVQPLGEVGYGPVGVGVTPSEALVFVSPVPKVDAGVVFAADWHNGFINNSGISIGLFAGKAGNKRGLAGGIGGGTYLTFSSVANCLKNF